MAGGLCSAGSGGAEKKHREKKEAPPETSNTNIELQVLFVEDIWKPMVIEASYWYT
jgi:hypothetical protein